MNGGPWAPVAAGLLIFSLLVLLAMAIHGQLNNPRFGDHLRASLGITVSALVATLVVLSFQVVYGPVTIHINGVLDFKGAGGPIVMWILCFWTIAGAVRLLWENAPRS